MEKFRYVDDLEAWLEPMGYEQFWRAVKPHCLILEYRSLCDAQVDSGEVALDVILCGLKVMATYELTRRHKLMRKPVTPWLKVVGAQD